MSTKEQRRAVFNDLLLRVDSITPVMDVSLNEILALRAKVEALTKQDASYKMLTESLEKRLSYALLNCRELDEARATLDSEREANMRLTVENYELTEVLGKARHALEFMREGFDSGNIRSRPYIDMRTHVSSFEIKHPSDMVSAALAAIDAVSGGKGGA